MMRTLDQSVESCLNNKGDPAYYESAIKIACWAHAELITIQPFEDGNKRIARLLLNIVLLRLKVSAVALEIPHAEYMSALLAYWDGDKRPFEDMVTVLLVEQE